MLAANVGQTYGQAVHLAEHARAVRQFDTRVFAVVLQQHDRALVHSAEFYGLFKVVSPHNHLQRIPDGADLGSILRSPSPYAFLPE